VNNSSLQSLREGLGQVLYGKDEVIEITMIAALAGGHLLIEDVPGVGKTTLGKAMAQLLGADFKRIQFTADLMPSDLTGVYMYQPHHSKFIFQPGPIFCNIVLADEMNRASPKTQSSLLEAMGEQQISIDRKTHYLPNPFWVIATQNPLSFAGTYPLPESQLDRFMLSTKIGYPNIHAEHQALKRKGQTSLNSHSSSNSLAVNQTSPNQPSLHQNSVAQQNKIKLSPILNIEMWLTLQEKVSHVHVSDDVIRYLLSIVTQTRTHDQLKLGVSTRGALSWQKACQARAVLEGRDYVTPDDVQALAVPALQHRIWPKRQFQSHFKADILVESLLKQTTLPHQ
jgi:MoxR-like ATPase